MNKYTRITNFSGLTLLLCFYVFAYLQIEIIDFNKHGVAFINKSKVPRKDRMDLAWEQEFELTKDP
ncbi:MAG: hypothetical protein Q8R57_01460, partial [Bacteroidota bacterium]|nr:hypothetical protein [Bacteroidota bacterium]